MKFKLLRNATCLIEWCNKLALIDPMLGDKNSFDPMPWTSNGIRNPTKPLPISQDELVDLLDNIDMILLTHLHYDHWDSEAVRLIKKDKLIICQPADKEKLVQQGFKNILDVESVLRLDDITIYRTEAKHGTGEMGKRMGQGSGFVLEGYGQKLYISGDTIWCSEVKKVIDEHKPDYIVVNSGGARFEIGGPVIMDLEQLASLTSYYVSEIICVHLEALNHCYTTRKELSKYFQISGYLGKGYVPEDGEEIIF